MSDVHDASFGQSFLTLGWEVQGQDPRYWLSDLSSPGKQSANDLVRVPAHLVGAHTAIIAQSGSGKSFFLGRLIEELILQTSASCLIFDPNGDFTKIHETAPEELWTEARYDRLRRKGILPHEAAREEFFSRWDPILTRTRIKTGYHGEPPYKKFQVWWQSVSMAFFAEEVDPLLQSELYHCHDFVKAFGEVFELLNDPTGRLGEFLSQAQRVLTLGRTNLEGVRAEFHPARIEEQIKSDPLNATSKKEIDLRVKRFFESLLNAVHCASLTVQSFYFGKARFYESSGIVRTSVRRNGLRKSSEHDSRRRLEVVDLLSLGDPNTQMLAIYSNLETTWEHARDDWKEAMKSDLEDVRTPTFVIVDEAHNLMPAQTRSKAANLVKEEFKRIIAEGRKYGLFLVLVTQRPDKLDPIILSECENKAIMKLGSESVIEVTRKMLGLEDLAPNLLRKCLEFESGRVLLAGSWCPDGPRICYVAARRTLEGGRSLQTDVWAVPPDVMGLGLAPEAKKAAIELLSNHPHIKFSAGRRSINDYANKMASTLVAATEIEQPRPIPRGLVVIALARTNILDIEGDLHQQVAGKLRNWLNAESGYITQTELADQLANLITQLIPSDRAKVSGHLTGEAFDIDAPTQNPDAVERTIKTLRHLHAFTKAAHQEGVWHLHFRIAEGNA